MEKTRLLALLLVVALAAPFLHAGLPATGDVVLRLKDAQQRPVANATVTLEYTSTDPILGELHKTDVVASDAFGIAQQTIDADLNTPVKITIEYNLLSESMDLSAWSGGTDRFVNLALSDFSVRVIDSDGNPLSNVPLRVATERANFTAAVNATGYRIFSQYYNGISYDVFAEYGASDISVQLTPDGKLHTIQVPTYTIEVRTFNEQGHSVLSEMNLTYSAVGTVTKRTAGIDGLFTQIPEGNATITIGHNNQTITDTFYVNASVIHSYTFDETAPTISRPWVIPEKPVPENEVQVAANVTDEGIYAAGMPPVVNLIPPVLLNYSLDGINWQTANMFPQPPDNRTYVARLAGFPANSLVRYVVIAHDSANNYVLSPQYTFNTFVNETGDHNVPGPDILQMLLPYWWIPAIAILAAIAYSIKKRFF